MAFSSAWDRFPRQRGLASYVMVSWRPNPLGDFAKQQKARGCKSVSSDSPNLMVPKVWPKNARPGCASPAHMHLLSYKNNCQWLPLSCPLSCGDTFGPPYPPPFLRIPHLEGSL